MVDFHSHLLPQIDDGSRSIEESMQMLKMEYIQGVRVAVATPHFYAENSSIESFLHKREHSFQNVEEEANRQSLAVPKLLLGAEVLYFDGIGKAGQIGRLCVQGTNLMLLEMPFCQWDRNMLDNVWRLLNRQGLKVMLAHIDRYLPFQKDMGYMEELLQMPVFVQANGSAFLKTIGRRKILGMVAKGKVHVLGSDCHNMGSRAPNLEQARKIIEQKLGLLQLKQIDANSTHILETVKI